MREETVQEIWKAIPEYAKTYQVSNLGRVKSTRTGKILTPFTNKRGYVSHNVSVNGVRSNIYVHVAVLESFVSARPVGMWALHKDDNPSNNQLNNLYWGTPSQNNTDAIKNRKKKLKTHCPSGHEYKDPNVIYRKTGRQCRSCENARIYCRLYPSVDFKTKADARYAELMSTRVDSQSSR